MYILIPGSISTLLPHPKAKATDYGAYYMGQLTYTAVELQSYVQGQTKKQKTMY